MTVELDAINCGFAAVIACLVYCALFWLVWVASERHHPRFSQLPATPVATGSDSGKAALPTFTMGEKADFCSRVISTVHCVVILPIIVVESLKGRWRWDLEPADPDASIVMLQIALCISAGYFTGDLVMIVLFRMPLWGVFAAHHVFALIPIGTNVFSNDCRYGSTLVIALFLLVEITTIPLNFQTFAEQAGYRPDSRLYTVCFYLTFILWIPSRIVVPIAMDVLMITRIAAPRPFADIRCFIPGMISAFAISLFCVAVFLGLLVPAVRLRWIADKPRGEPGVSVKAEGAATPIFGHTDDAGFTEAEEMLTHIP